MNYESEGKNDIAEYNILSLPTLGDFMDTEMVMLPLETAKSNKREIPDLLEQLIAENPEMELTLKRKPDSHSGKQMNKINN